MWTHPGATSSTASSILLRGFLHWCRLTPGPDLVSTAAGCVQLHMALLCPWGRVSMKTDILSFSCGAPEGVHTHTYTCIHKYSIHTHVLTHLHTHRNTHIHRHAHTRMHTLQILSDHMTCTIYLSWCPSCPDHPQSRCPECCPEAPAEPWSPMWMRPWSLHRLVLRHLSVCLSGTQLRAPCPSPVQPAPQGPACPAWGGGRQGSSSLVQEYTFLWPRWRLPGEQDMPGSPGLLAVLQLAHTRASHLKFWMWKTRHSSGKCREVGRGGLGLAAGERRWGLWG